MRDNPTTPPPTAGVPPGGPPRPDRTAAEEDAAAAAFQVERRDRRRVAEELHDRPIQALTAAQWQLEALATDLPADARERLLASTRALGDAQRQLRAMMARLDPGGLEHDGLALAVQDLLDGLEDDDDVAISLDTSTLTDPPIGVAAVVLRLLDDLLATARAGGAPRRLAVRLGDDEGGVRLEVVDEGTDGARDAGGEPSWRAELAAAAGGWCHREVDVHGTRTVCWLPRW
jgi:two-component system, NarL family, sensor kinase